MTPKQTIQQFLDESIHNCRQCGGNDWHVGEIVPSGTSDVTCGCCGWIEIPAARSVYTDFAPI